MISGKYSLNLISVFNFLKIFLKRKKNGVPKKVRHSMRSKTWTLYLAKKKCSCLKKLESLKSDNFEKLRFDGSSTWIPIQIVVQHRKSPGTRRKQTHITSRAPWIVNIGLQIFSLQHYKKFTLSKPTLPEIVVLFALRDTY